MSKKQKKMLIRILVAFATFVVVSLLPLEEWLPAEQATIASFVLFAIPYLIAGYDVLRRAALGIAHRQFLDENFLMSIATLGAFALVLFPEAEEYFQEGTAVMLFYQVGELFQSYAVGKSRKSIADMMDIAPDYANMEIDGEIQEVDPDEVEVGDEIVIKVGERVPIDGIITSGESYLDTSALTGESVPRHVFPGDEVISGCINTTGLLKVQTTKVFGESTVSRILELVENASEKKARTENFITRFARYYTPIVVGVALALAIIPPAFLGGAWADWIQRGLIFLVVSCPCALVISVPLSFFGGIGGASRKGVLVKGSNYLEALAQVETVVFDKTGTLTNGTFEVVAVHPEQGVTSEDLMSMAAHMEAYSTHPIAASIRKKFTGEINRERLRDVSEIGGRGISALLDGKKTLVGNDVLMKEEGVQIADCDTIGTILHVAQDGAYLGHIVIADVVKEDAPKAISALYAAGVKKTVMLTGDRNDVAKSVASSLNISEFHAQLLPQDKVYWVEKLLSETSSESGKGNEGTSGPKLAFVGDGINDAPVLTRADVGIAMGAMGSDAAIEAADVVLMEDKPSRIADAIAIARKTMRIVWQNIVFALGVKFAVLGLAAFGMATMWLAVFADVGVAVLAILNAMRAMRVK